MKLHTSQYIQSLQAPPPPSHSSNSLTWTGINKTWFCKRMHATKFSRLNECAQFWEVFLQVFYSGIRETFVIFQKNLVGDVHNQLRILISSIWLGTYYINIVQIVGNQELGSQPGSDLKVTRNTDSTRTDNHMIFRFSK